MQNHLVQNGSGLFGKPGSHQKSAFDLASGLTGRGSSGSAFNPSLVSGWPMNEGSGLTLNDVSGKANTATISAAGAVTWQTNGSIPGTTVSWSGSGYARAANAALTAFDGTTPFSVCSWIIPSVINTDNYYVSNMDLSVSAAPGWLLEIQTGGVERVYIINSLSGGNYIDVSTSPGAVSTGALSYTCFTYDGSKTAAGLLIYSNGVTHGHIVNKDTLTGSAASPNAITLGAIQNGASFSGALHGAQTFTAIYSTALTPTQIAAYYALGPRIN